MTELTDAMVERGAVALINADAQEPYDRPLDDWRPAALARAVLEAALGDSPLREREDGWPD